MRNEKNRPGGELERLGTLFFRKVFVIGIFINVTYRMRRNGGVDVILQILINKNHPIAVRFYEPIKAIVIIEMHKKAIGLTPGCDMTNVSILGVSVTIYKNANDFILITDQEIHLAVGFGVG